MLKTALRKETFALQALLVLGAALLCSCANEYTILRSNSEALQELHADNEYVIGCGDRLTVSVWGQEGLQTDTVVRPDGNISLPLVGDVHAEGLSTEALKQELDLRYKEFIFEPSASVIVREINSLKIYVLGEVSRPGEYDLIAYTDVLQALGKAGGFTIYAKKNRIQIIRTFGGEKIKIKFNYSQVIRGKNLDQNIPLKPGDVIIVP